MSAALTWDRDLLEGDLSIDTDHIELDDGLETAVILSLFCDRRASPEDLQDSNETDLRGWWADAYPEVDGDLWGSRLWTLRRKGKITNDVLREAERYAEESLDWMLADGVASKVVASAEDLGGGILGIGVEITRPTDPASKWRGNWEVYLGV